MITKTRHLTLPGAALLALSLVVPAWAGGDEGNRTITLITDEGETYVCRFGDDETIRLVERDSGEEVFELDLAQIEKTLEDAFADLEETLDDLDLDIHFDGDDNFLRVAADDDEVVLDFDAILEGVSEACTALGEMDFVDAHHRFRAPDGMEELETELKALREEMRELKKELREERRRARH